MRSGTRFDKGPPTIEHEGLATDYIRHYHDAVSQASNILMDKPDRFASHTFL